MSGGCQSYPPALTFGCMPDQPTFLERIPTIIVGDHDEMGRLVACRIAELIRQAQAAAGAPTTTTTAPAGATTTTR